jgi:hypothetical protein
MLRCQETQSTAPYLVDNAVCLVGGVLAVGSWVSVRECGCDRETDARK